jgi:hypothetical protein
MIVSVGYLSSVKSSKPLVCLKPTQQILCVFYIQVIIKSIFLGQFLFLFFYSDPINIMSAPTIIVDAQGDIILECCLAARPDIGPVYPGG